MFWDLVGATFGLEIKSKDAMISFLTKNFIGITDLVEKCHRGPQVRTTAKMRKNNSSLSSLDSDLIIKEYRDVIRSIIDNNIKIVYCTSAFVKKHLSYIDKFNELKCKIVVLPSPSPSYSRSIGSMEKYKDMVKDGLVKNTKEYRILEYRDIFKDIL